MSNTIWNREIEIGLKDFFNSFLFYMNGDNVGKPISVKVRKPDDDFRKESYPVVYLQSLQQGLNTKRYDPTERVVSRDESTNTLVTEEAPIPFDCVYQIDFYSQLNSEINDMNQKFLAKSHGGRYFNLPVKDQSGNDWDLLVMRRGMGYEVRRDAIDGETRLFHSVYTFTVQTQLNENIQHTKPMVLSVDTPNLNKGG